MASFSREGTIADFQRLISDIYSEPDDRMFSVPNLLSNMERFTMRAIKGIRKGDTEKLTLNLEIAFSWFMSIANRLHITIEDALWKRFPYHCSYCAECPCVCKTIKQDRRLQADSSHVNKPHSLVDFQHMFQEIYPPSLRSLADAGIHLAEETGEVSEAVHVFLGEHKAEQFEDIRNEMADYASCLFGVANSSSIELATVLSDFFENNCHVCHGAPCECKFSSIAQFPS
jgi:NTP pyrophosphatase (non-canonical NTP hydrolase)